MIHEVEANTLGETAMMAFTVSFEQAQIVLSNRRATLLDPGPKGLLA